MRTGGNGRTLACARQMYDMQVGARRGEWTELMRPVVAKLTGEDLVTVSAYVASLMPTTAPAATRAERR